MVAAGGFHTCAVRVNGEIRCWGSNAFGQLGDGSTTSSNVPIAPFNIGPDTLYGPVTGVTVGGSHTCALRSTGQVSCWGDNFSGQLGTGSFTAPGPTPRSVANLNGVTALAAGDAHTCALRSTGAVSCWGDNVNGQLGNGTFTNSAVAGAVTGLSGATSVVAGAAFSCAQRSSGGPVCWGENLYGQLGNGITLPPPPQPGDPPPPPLKESTPQTVVGLSGVTAIGRGAEHACAVTTSGFVSCWGRNDLQQLGDGTTTSTATPQPTIGLLGMNQVAGGEDHTCAMRANGTAVCWGDNTYGQLGDNTTTSSGVPVAVVAL
jgi:alpha-tubulin suppressor-like RCC1 family protein